MTTVGGNNVAYGSGGYYEAQIVYTLSYPSSSTYEIDWERRVYHSTSMYDSTNDAGGSGDLGGTNDYASKTYSDSNSGYMSYESGTKTGSRVYGSTIVLEDTFWVEDLAEGSGGGGRSTANATITVAARPYDIPSAPGTPTVASTTDDGTTASWTDPSNWGGNDTSDFHIQIADNSAFTGATQYTVTNANSRVFTGLDPNKTYYLRVRGYNAAGNGSWSGTRTFTTLASLATAPGTPVISLLAGVTAKATWADPSSWGGDDTSDFKVQVDDNSAFTSPTGYLVTDANFKDITGLVKNTTHYVRVRAVNSAGDGAWSATQSFTTLNDPGVPTGLFADNITAVEGDINWSNPANNGGSSITGFDVQVDNNADFSSPIVNAVSYVGNEYVLSGLAPATIHYWRVRAKTAIGTSAWASSSFLTLNTGFINIGGVNKKITDAWVQTAPGVIKKVTTVWVKVNETTWKK